MDTNNNVADVINEIEKKLTRDEIAERLREFGEANKGYLTVSATGQLANYIRALRDPELVEWAARYCLESDSFALACGASDGVDNYLPVVTREARMNLLAGMAVHPNEYVNLGRRLPALYALPEIEESVRHITRAESFVWDEKDMALLFGAALKSISEPLDPEKDEEREVHAPRHYQLAQALFARSVDVYNQAGSYGQIVPPLVENMRIGITVYKIKTTMLDKLSGPQAVQIMDALMAAKWHPALYEVANYLDELLPKVGDKKFVEYANCLADFKQTQDLEMLNVKQAAQNAMARMVRQRDFPWRLAPALSRNYAAALKTGLRQRSPRRPVGGKRRGGIFQP